ncbi:hypothetical protein HY571_01235, partial [Candidatus Micrarchaeota archaeon]|nr:hypothetical protein [Candidatus Micrarchaeota archaeon]
LLETATNMLREKKSEEEIGKKLGEIAKKKAKVVIKNGKIEVELSSLSC